MPYSSFQLVGDVGKPHQAGEVSDISMTSRNQVLTKALKEAIRKKLPGPLVFANQKTTEVYPVVNNNNVMCGPLAQLAEQLTLNQ